MIDVGLISGGIGRVVANILSSAEESGMPIQYLNPYLKYRGGKLVRTQLPMIPYSLKYFKYIIELFWSIHTALRVLPKKELMIIVNSHKSFTFIYWWKIFQKTKLIFMMHGGVDITQIGLIKRFAIKRANLVITVTDQAKQQILKLNKNITTLHNALPSDYIRYWMENATTRQQAKAALNLEQDAYICGYVGRFDKQKGLALLIDAFRTSKISLANNKTKFQLILCGYSASEIAELNNLQRMIGRHESGDIHFYPFAEDPTPYYKAIDIFVLPSVLKKGFDVEGCSIALLEAMYSGCGILASDIGGNSEIIIDRRDGLLFKPNDKNDLAEKLLRLLKDKVLTERLKSNSSATIREYLPCEYINLFMNTINVPDE